MRFHPGRLLGIVMGLVILVAIFLVPFISAPTAQTLFGRVGPMLTNIGAVQSLPDPNLVTYSYLLIVAFILLLVAGLVGLFPLGTGVLGVVALGMVTVAPFLIVSPQVSTLAQLGAGFYVGWVASIVSLGGSFWHGKPKQQVAIKAEKISVEPEKKPEGSP